MSVEAQEGEGARVGGKGITTQGTYYCRWAHPEWRHLTPNPLGREGGLLVQSLLASETNCNLYYYLCPAHFWHVILNPMLGLGF